MANHVVLVEDDVPGAKLVKKPGECSVEILKRWLECHGLKKSGKKSELINRVNQSIGLIKVDPKVDGGKWYDIKSKGEGLPTSSNKLEITTPARGWNNFPGTNIPSMFNYGHIYFYLVESVDEMFLSDDSGIIWYGHSKTTEKRTNVKRQWIY